jgi:endonuclease/exonuclease/phosphatase (EEP) superfamily protein YafD
MDPITVLWKWSLDNHVFASPDWAIIKRIKREVGPAIGSDHRPVVTEWRLRHAR